MAYKSMNIKSTSWNLFKKLCAINDTTMSKEIHSFINEYNEKYRGLIK